MTQRTIQQHGASIQSSSEAAFSEGNNLYQGTSQGVVNTMANQNLGVPLTSAKQVLGMGRNKTGGGNVQNNLVGFSDSKNSGNKY